MNVLSTCSANEDLRSTYIWQLRDELGCKRLFASLGYKSSFGLFVFCFPLCANQAICYILEDGAVEEEWFLLHKANLRAPPLYI